MSTPAAAAEGKGERGESGAMYVGERNAEGGGKIKGGGVPKTPKSKRGRPSLGEGKEYLSIYPRSAIRECKLEKPIQEQEKEGEAEARAGGKRRESLPKTAPADRPLTAKDVQIRSNLADWERARRGGKWVRQSKPEDWGWRYFYPCRRVTNPKEQKLLLSVDDCKLDTDNKGKSLYWFVPYRKTSKDKVKEDFDPFFPKEVLPFNYGRKPHEDPNAWSEKGIKAFLDCCAKDKHGPNKGCALETMDLAKRFLAEAQQREANKEQGAADSARMLYMQDTSSEDGAPDSGEDSSDREGDDDVGDGERKEARGGGKTQRKRQQQQQQQQQQEQQRRHKKEKSDKRKNAEEGGWGGSNVAVAVGDTAARSAEKRSKLGASGSASLVAPA